MGQVGKGQHESAELVPQHLGLLIQGVGLVADLPHLGPHLFRGFLSLGACLPDLLADPVPFGVQVVALGDGGADLGVQLQDFSDRVFFAPCLKRAAHLIWVFSYVFDG